MEYSVAVDGLNKELFVIAPDVEAPFVPGDEVAITLALRGVALVHASPRHGPA
jgi:hypothetical protein